MAPDIRPSHASQPTQFPFPVLRRLVSNPFRFTHKISLFLICSLYLITYTYISTVTASFFQVYERYWLEIFLLKFSKRDVIFLFFAISFCAVYFVLTADVCTGIWSAWSVSVCAVFFCMERVLESFYL
jgi:hypothetical protein